MHRRFNRLSSLRSRELLGLAREWSAHALKGVRRPRAAEVTRAIAGIEIALTIAFAVASGLLVWKVFEPPAWAAVDSVPASSQVRRVGAPAVLTNIDPFHRVARAPAGSPAAARAPETMLDLQLFGIRAGVDGGPGSAIIGTPDNVQSVYSVGQDIMPGVRLEQVLPGRVVIRRNGVSESLSFERENAALLVPAVAVTEAPAARRLDFDAMRSVVSQLRFVPGERDGARGLLLEGSSDPAVLQQTGLEPGDLLLSVNGTPVDSVAALAPLAGSGAQGLTLEVERKGQRKFHRLEIDRVQ